MLKWFGRQPNEDIPPLVEMPRAGDQIELDEEELKAAARTELGRVIQKAETEGRRFTRSVERELEDYATAEGLAKLLDLARSRIDASDLTGGARTCVKVIGIAGTMHNPRIFAEFEAWLLLAEIFAEHGDKGRSRSFLHTANEKASETIEELRQQAGEALIPWQEFKADWESKTRKLKTTIR